MSKWILGFRNVADYSPIYCWNHFPEFLLVLFIEHSCHWKWFSFLHCKGSVHMKNWEVVRDISRQNVIEWTIQITMVIREYTINEGSRSISASRGTGNQGKKLITVHSIHKCICQVMCFRIKQVNIVVTYQYTSLFSMRSCFSTLASVILQSIIFVFGILFITPITIFFLAFIYYLSISIKIDYIYRKSLDHCVQHMPSSL